jgi:hypothetical protein
LNVLSWLTCGKRHARSGWGAFKLANPSQEIQEYHPGLSRDD